MVRNTLKTHFQDLIKGVVGLSLLAVFAFSPQELVSPEAAALGRAPAAAQQAKKKSWLARLGLKRVSYDDNSHLDAAAKSQSTWEKIFNPKFVQEINSKYKAQVAVAEQTAHSPYRRATQFEQEQYESRRKDFSSWMAKEALNSQVKSMFAKADKTSGGMKVVNGLRAVTGGEDFGPAAPASAAPAAEKIPTRLRTRMNLLHATGSVVFQNPVVTTNVNVSAKGDDNVTVDMSKEIKEITLNSQAKYGVNSQKLSLNVNKKITDEINLGVSNESYTGSKKPDEAVARSEQKVMMNYTIGF